MAKPRSGSSYSSSSFKERKKENTWTAWHIHTQTGTNTKHNSTKHAYQIPIYLSIYIYICDKRSRRPLATWSAVAVKIDINMFSTFFPTATWVCSRRSIIQGCIGQCRAMYKCVSLFFYPLA
jgi:hypothetical protein